MSTSRRVALHRVGFVGPCGVGLESFARWWTGGRPSTAGPLTALPDEGLPVEQACEVRGWKGRQHLPERKAIKLMYPPVQFGVTAALEAWGGPARDDAPGDAVDPERRGMFIGCGHSVDEDWTFREAIDNSVRDGAFDLELFAREGQPLVNPLWLVKGLSNNVLAFTAKLLKLRGDNDNIEGGAAGPLAALSTAADAIACGSIDVALVGGADTLLTVEDLLGLARHGGFEGGPPFLPSQGAAIGLLTLAEPGDFAVLGHASTTGAISLQHLGGPGPMPGADEALERASRLARARAAEILDVDEVTVDRVLRGPRIGSGEGDVPLSPALGDAGAASGAWLMAAAWASRELDGLQGPIELQAVGPSGEASVVILGTLP